MLLLPLENGNTRHAKLTQQIKSNDQGLQALIFTAEGDMRQAINNLQSTWSGFGFVSADNVYKICDQPHPHKIRAMIKVSGGFTQAAVSYELGSGPIATG